MTLRSRSPLLPLSTISSMSVRGPKKKKGGAKIEAPDTNDIVNIFKDKPDAVIHPTDRYPPWLMNMLEETYTPDDVVMQMYRGERIPTPKEQWSLSKSYRRTQLKDQNKLFLEEKIYESDEDEGEDVGHFAEEDLDQQAGTGAAAGEKKEGEATGEKKEGEAGGEKKEGGEKGEEKKA